MGIGGILPQVCVWIRAIPLGERFVGTREQQSKAPCGLGSSGSSRAQRGHCRELGGRLKWLQAVQVTQSVVTGEGKRHVGQQQGMAGQFKQQGVQEGTATLLTLEVSSPQGIVFFTCLT